MKSDYAFIVGATKTYIPELCALLNSLDYVGNIQDVYVLGIELDSDFVNQFDKLNYKVILHDINEQEWQEAHGKSEVVCRKRYYFADEIGKDYKAICVLDADMIFTRNPILFFEIAEKTGLVLGASKEQNQKYDDPHHQFKGEWIIPKGTCPESDLCNCPLFVDTKIWGKALRESFTIFIDGFNEMKGDNFRGADMAAMNIMLLKYGSADKTIAMPNIQWIASNEEALKPYMRAITDRGKIKTECGIPIFSYHGHWGHIKWRENQLANRHHCASTYLKAIKSPEVQEHLDSQAKGSLNLLYENFKKMFHYKIKITPNNYRHPENADYKEEYGDLWD